jgi:FlaA1/EpsC-like NDP-sugar epimerase
MQVVGFLDPDRFARGRTMGGVGILGTPDDLPQLVMRHRADLVLIPELDRPAAEMRALVATCQALGVRSRALPAVESLLAGTPRSATEGVDFDALLSRDPVTVDAAPLGPLLAGRVVLVSGAAGSIGSEIARQVMAQGPRRLVLLDHSENGLFFIDRELRTMSGDIEVVPCLASITDLGRIREVFARSRPEVVLHAAAHKHVSMMENHPGEAVKNNVLGTRILVDEAVRAGVHAFVMISTDKAVRPSSVMGASKRLAEMYVQALAIESAMRLVTVRFGNVLGSNGSVAPIFLDQIRRGGPVTVTHPEMTRYFMTIPEAARLVLQAAALGEGGEIFVLDMGEPIKVVDLARALIRLAGATAGQDVAVQFTGLRPGEKLYEELYDVGEDRRSTSHPKIFRAWHRTFAIRLLRAALDRLAGVINGDDKSILSILTEVVPGYRPDRLNVSAISEGDPFLVNEAEVVDLERFTSAASATCAKRSRPHAHPPSPASA